MEKAKVEERLRDGLLSFGKIGTVRDKNNKIDKTKDPFKPEMELYFNYVYIRQSDYEKIGAHQVIDEKVKTYYIKDVEKSHKVKINNILYDITRIDPDKKRKYLYWYLTKVSETIE